MKQYATLRVYDTKYELYDQNGKVIISEEFPRTYYIYEKAIALNMVSKHGWKIEFPIEDCSGWYVVSR